MCSLGSFEVQVNLTTDGFPEEISWTLTDINENVIGNASLNSLDEEIDCALCLDVYIQVLQVISRAGL